MFDVWCRLFKRWRVYTICIRECRITANVVSIHSFYVALFSALEQTHCAYWHVILNEWLYPFIARIINIHGSGVLIALFGCCMAGATWNAAVSAQVLCKQCHFIQSHIGRVCVCLAVKLPPLLAEWPGPFTCYCVLSRHAMDPNRNTRSHLRDPDERGPPSIRWTLALFERQHWGNFWNTRCSAYIQIQNTEILLSMNNIEICIFS